MKTNVTLTEGDLAEAIKDFLRKKGLSVVGTISFNASTCEDRGMTSTYVTASAEVVTVLPGSACRADDGWK